MTLLECKRYIVSMYTMSFNFQFHLTYNRKPLLNLKFEPDTSKPSSLTLYLRILPVERPWDLILLQIFVRIVEEVDLKNLILFFKFLNNIGGYFRRYSKIMFSSIGLNLLAI